MPVVRRGIVWIYLFSGGKYVLNHGTPQSGWLYRILFLLALVPWFWLPHAALAKVEASGQARPANDVFPSPAALEPAVDFWVKVFSEWRRDQVALHDSEYLGVVYRVLEVPGPVAEGLTGAQQKWLSRQREALSHDLSRLAKKRAAGQALNREEQALLASITRGGGQLKYAANRVRAQRGTRERFLRGLEISGRYDQRFREIFRAAGLPEDLAYLPHVESSFQYHAKSHVGAAGIWQFMPATGRQYMRVNSAVDERLDPIIAARAAAAYLGQAYRDLGSWPLALTSYNHGVGGMRRARSRFGHDFARIVREYDSPSFGFASRNFYVEFLAVRRIAQSPQRYFPEGVRYEDPAPVQAMVLKHSQHIRDISRQTGHDLALLKALNPAWTTRTHQGRNQVPAGSTVWVPEGEIAIDVAALAHSEFASLQPGRVEHHVTKGESLWSIARRYGTSVSYLCQLNGLDPKRPRIQVGQVLNLPGANAQAGARKAALITAAEPTVTTHRVSRGDTPFGIAATYKVNLRDLLAANNMTRQTKIHPGQELIIPNQ